MTRFMNSSKPCSTLAVVVGKAAPLASHPDLPFYSDCQLLVQPYGYRRALLKQLENKVYRCKQSLPPATSAAAIHFASKCWSLALCACFGSSCQGWRPERELRSTSREGEVLCFFCNGSGLADQKWQQLVSIPSTEIGHLLLLSCAIFVSRKPVGLLTPLQD
jgi:hypothetical protein